MRAESTSEDVSAASSPEQSPPPWAHAAGSEALLLPMLPADLSEGGVPGQGRLPSGQGEREALSAVPERDPFSGLGPSAEGLPPDQSSAGRPHG